MKTDDNYKAISNQFQDQGWAPFDKGIAIATKEYQTTVGLKEAVVYLYESSLLDERGPLLMLSGHYYSEGRNVLEPHTVFIPKNADADSRYELVKAFIEKVDSEIASTYAVRLLANRQEDDSPRF